MPATEEYIDNASKLAQDVVNEWGINVRAGNASSLPDEFLTLNECACRYIDARDLADNHRKFNDLAEEDVTREAATRQAFAEVYKRYVERVSGQSSATSPSPRNEK